MSNLRIDDWFRLNCGDLVHTHDDPRHVGRVEAIHNSYEVKVRWHGTRWISFLTREELHRLTWQERKEYES